MFLKGSVCLVLLLIMAVFGNQLKICKEKMKVDTEKEQCSLRRTIRVQIC